MSYPIEELEFMQNKTSPIILDVGCAIAGDAIRFGNLYEKGKVYAFEADPAMIEAAKIAIDKNSLHDNITLIEKAVSHLDGTISWHHADIAENHRKGRFKALLDIDGENPPDWFAGSSSGTIKKPLDHPGRFPHVLYDEATISVPSTKLDTWFKELDFDQIDFIWSDVNGGELEFIMGGLETITNHVLYFWTECLQNNPTLWEGQPTKNQICYLLPDFKIVFDDGNDILFLNTKLATANTSK